MERELFSQHIERNEYGNLKLRAETQTVECLYGVIKRMAVARHALLQETMETPRQLTQECTQLVDTMGEAMRSFHSVVQMQSQGMQALQSQVGLTAVPPPPPSPPDYVGLGKALLEILRDLGMKAMDSGFGRRELPPRKAEQLSEPIEVGGSEPTRHARSEESIAPDTIGADKAREKAETTGELRRVLTRLGEVDVARAFASAESFSDSLTDVRKEIKAGRAEAVSKGAAAVKTPPSPPPISHRASPMLAATSRPASSPAAQRLPRAQSPPEGIPSPA